MGPSTFLRFVFLLICLLAYSLVVSGQETYTDEELDAMTDDELELICVVRGFALVKDHVDEQTGEVYVLQHSDYIEAAKQCLAIESEMNDILEEHPELREELEEELNKMQQEQEERRAELENLQQQLQQKEADASDAESGNPAFIGKPKSEELQEESASGDPAIPAAEEQQIIEESETLEEDIEEETIEASADASIESEEQPDESIDESSSAQSTTDKTEGLEISDEERIPLNEQEEAALAEQEEITDELTMEYLRTEFIKYVKKDIERLTRILVPILKPMLNAGDLAIKYIRAIFSTLRDAYNSQANSSQESA